MRAIEFLLEAAYDSLVLSMKTANPDQVANIDAQVRWAKTALVKSDRITWYLRIMQAWLSGNDTKLKPLLGDYPAITSWEAMGQLGEQIQHYLGFDDAKIQNYAFVKQPASQVIADLDRLQREWANREAAKPKPVKTQAGDRVLFDFGGGLEWWWVDRAYCDEESRSGNHCGNVVGKTKKNQRILSLRKNGHVLLTFILEPDGSLGEMKANGNQKPAEKYHPQIIKLLLWDKVTGISGMGYLPDANFSVFDLNEKYLDYVDQHKPQLIADQLKITPFDLLKQPDHMRKRYADQVPKLKAIIENPSHENWERLIESDAEKIIYAPHDLPGFKELLLSTFSKSGDPGRLLLKCPNTISRNRSLIMDLIGVAPYVISGVVPNVLDHEMCMAAVESYGDVLLYVPDGLKTPEVCMAAARADGLVLRYVPEDLKTSDICMTAVKNRGIALKYVPDDMKTLEMCMVAVKSNEYSLRYVPDGLKTPEMCMAAVKENGDVLQYVPDDLKTHELCRVAVNSDSGAMEFVPDEIKPLLPD